MQLLKIKIKLLLGIKLQVTAYYKNKPKWQITWKRTFNRDGIFNRDENDGIFNWNGIFNRDGIFIWNGIFNRDGIFN